MSASSVPSWDEGIDGLEAHLSSLRAAGLTVNDCRVIGYLIGFYRSHGRCPETLRWVPLFENVPGATIQCKYAAGHGGMHAAGEHGSATGEVSWPVKSRRVGAGS